MFIRKLFEIDQRLKLLMGIYDQPLNSVTGTQILENEEIKCLPKAKQLKLLDVGVMTVTTAIKKVINGIAFLMPQAAAINVLFCGWKRTWRNYFATFI